MVDIFTDVLVFDGLRSIDMSVKWTIVACGTINVESYFHNKEEGQRMEGQG